MMTITVVGGDPKRADSFWVEVQRFVGAMIGDTKGKLTRIARPDGQCDYRTFGTYELTYRTRVEEHEIMLELR